MTARRHPGIDLSWLILARLVSGLIVAVLASMVGAQHYTSISGAPTREQVMEGRPDAPGSAEAILARYGARCWTSQAPADAVMGGAIIRDRPNDPYRYVSGHALTRAVEQAVSGIDHGIDTVLAFCSPA